MTVAAPSGVVTFLFTDVEGSTRRWEADAQAMRAALVVHDKVLRTAIEAYDGFLFSHTGDGFVAAFASPMSAVNAAIDAQRELQLPVRMGLATGEAELRDGDYFGTVLNRAARVMAAGHGGQILLAESTAGLLSGVDLLDLGTSRSPTRWRGRQGTPENRTRQWCVQTADPHSPQAQPARWYGTGASRRTVLPSRTRHCSRREPLRYSRDRPTRRLRCRPIAPASAAPRG